MRSYCAACKAGCGMCYHRAALLWMQHLHWGEGRPTPKPITLDLARWVPGCTKGKREINLTAPADQLHIERVVRSSSVPTSKKGSTGLTVEAVRKNNALRKLLVLAKRERIKQDLRDTQDKLTEQIWNILLKSSKTKDDDKMENHKPVRVGEVMERLGTKDKTNGSESNWPSPTDVQVHLHHLINNGDGGRLSCRGGLAIVAVAPGNSTLDEHGLLSPLAELHVADRKS